MKPRLAILGGKPVRTKLFPAYNYIGNQEKKAVMGVMKSGVLSRFLGTWHDDFYGGPKVQRFEKAWSDAFGVKFSVAMNSCTSGLYAAIGACGLGPGDEVIVSPYSMTASAVAPMIYGAVPVFADIDPDTFCLNPESIRKNITPRTKAILVVHLFGHPADMDPIMEIARERRLRVIEDCAQAPMGRYGKRYVGSFGDLGVFSFNYHKQIQTGEGGMVVTNDPLLAEKVQLIRNHGEAVVESKGTEDLTNTIGFNYRMTEIEAVIGYEQLKKLPRLLEIRIGNAEYLADKLTQFPGLVPPVVRKNCRHVYYFHAVKFKKEVVGIDRNIFVEAVKAELPSAVLRETVPILACGYTKPLYLQPLYQQRLSRCAFNCPHYDGSVSYAKGICPNAELMYEEELFTHEYMRPGMTGSDLDDVIRAFEKVYEHIGELKTREPITV